MRNSKLWLSGIPGSGKTILASSLVEETAQASNPSRALAYFYCDYKDVEKQKPVQVLGSLAAQLARQNESAFAILQEFYDTCHPQDRIINPELSMLTDKLRAITNCFDDVSIIVDGLD